MGTVGTNVGTIIVTSFTYKPVINENAKGCTFAIVINRPRGGE